MSLGEWEHNNNMKMTVVIMHLNDFARTQLHLTFTCMTAFELLIFCCELSPLFPYIRIRLNPYHTVFLIDISG